jgi:hypothetical protein
MLRTSGPSVSMQFERKGGSIIIARVDVWKATPSDWQAIATFNFGDSLKLQESITQQLAQGTYTCVFQCYVHESLNGKYDFDFRVGNQQTFLDDGDVNTTSAPDDSKVFKDQFQLNVTQ